jgi:hypothetical protein
LSQEKKSQILKQQEKELEEVEWQKEQPVQLKQAVNTNKVQLEQISK